MPLSDEYPKFVCLTCEENLSRYALFAHQIEQVEQNWEIFFKNGTDIKIRTDEPMDCECDDSKPVIANEFLDIKIEMCDENFDDTVPEADTLINDALAIDSTNVVPSNVNLPEKKRKQRRKAIETGLKTTVNNSTEFERTCQHCNEPTFSSLERMYRHHRLKHPGIKISSCDICGVEFITKHAMCMHMKERHGTSGKMHQCQFCAKRFYSDREVKSHEKYHLNDRSYLCSLCGKGFNSKTLLNTHLKSKVHNADYKTIKHKQHPKKKYQTNKKIYRCVQCVPSKIFPTSEVLAHHRNVHKLYECEICKNSFLTLESLNRHKLLHSEKPRPFVCSVSISLLVF